MYDKKKCKKCKYHGNLGDKSGIYCNYTVLSGCGICLKRVGSEVIDTRGGDPKECRLYEKGRPKNTFKADFYL